MNWLAQIWDHLLEALKGLGRASPLLAVIGGYMIGLMQQLIPPLQFLSLVLACVYGVYQIRLARKRLAEKRPEPTELS